MKKPGRGPGAVNFAVLIAPLADVLKLQRLVPNGSLQIVATVEKPNAWPEARVARRSSSWRPAPRGMLHTAEAKEKESAACHRASKPCRRGGEHDWLLTYNAQILMPWLGAETANVCRKCSAIAIVKRPPAAE